MSEYKREKIVKWRAGYRFQFEPAQNKYVILYPEGMIQLNESASEIGRFIDGKMTTEQIIFQLIQKYPDAAELAIDVDDFMQVAQQQHWIDFV
ncbi:pyrroloquinoline quinone biosynthesis peptide chaperone PqqD [Acinetobacter gerneri]|jgi:pyrroloquinoline quinone biosynthesis protein D|uniref:PqqA binding protein n=1 Tax=Acinetobacter gerneri TaxID=202952 RepID=A0AAW8JT04_9GAMM|nr:pyrroloquinoline quinone biosynthesis peptide chaperone PqqD [Acinetobacter gerneri]MCH4245033.1 pyrroloquinoline quinone biosynthesis peptide chaperone PqqD [Acinetobacter gerneri]MDQ9011354.1 pyrroloquinoline quinone biosynthesis peptide chaperone PqqD [Acinetobacter gerneri]MDQ9015490.1 pyrroloquinoline quinone biosynthesis peptide chaperone PqqD [Acinetobacter gerneri]MDQ9026679.1 pyrroloquinoline quinone biosynthesis peptide chaperone PqqD [Acinetobacter gerneri]MDQ9053960.1 pyrroloqui